MELDKARGLTEALPFWQFGLVTEQENFSNSSTVTQSSKFHMLPENLLSLVQPASAAEMDIIRETAQRSLRSGLRLAFGVFVAWFVIAVALAVSWDLAFESGIRFVFVVAIAMTGASLGLRQSLLFQDVDGESLSVVLGVLPTLALAIVLTYALLHSRSTFRRMPPSYRVRPLVVSGLSFLGGVFLVLFAATLLTGRYGNIVLDQTLSVSLRMPGFWEYAFSGFALAFSMLVGVLFTSRVRGPFRFFRYFLASLGRFLVMFSVVVVLLGMLAWSRSVLGIQPVDVAEPSLWANMSPTERSGLFLSLLLGLPSVLIGIFFLALGASFAYVETSGLDIPLPAIISLSNQLENNDGVFEGVSLWSSSPWALALLMPLALVFLVVSARSSLRAFDPGTYRWWFLPAGLGIGVALALALRRALEISFYGMSETILLDVGNLQSSFSQVAESYLLSFQLTEFSAVAIGALLSGAVVALARERVKSGVSNGVSKIQFNGKRLPRRIAVATFLVVIVGLLGQVLAERYLVNQGGPAEVVAQKMDIILSGELDEAKALFETKGSQAWLDDAVLEEFRLPEDFGYELSIMNKRGAPWKLGETEGVAVVSGTTIPGVTIEFPFSASVESGPLGTKKLVYDGRFVTPDIEILFDDVLFTAGHSGVFVGDSIIQAGSYLMMPGVYEFRLPEKGFLAGNERKILAGSESHLASFTPRLLASDAYSARVRQEIESAAREWYERSCSKIGPRTLEDCFGEWYWRPEGESHSPDYIWQQESLSVRSVNCTVGLPDRKYREAALESLSYVQRARCDMNVVAERVKVSWDFRSCSSSSRTYCDVPIFESRELPLSFSVQSESTLFQDEDGEISNWFRPVW